MAVTGVHPRDEERSTKSNAECKVHAALKTGLPEGWTAWHSLRVRGSAGFDGEGDFVIAIPNRGLLLLEVKGGQVEQRDGRWYQNGRQMKQSPRDQGERFIRKLIGRLRDGDCAPPAFGVATCFPDTGFTQQPSQDDMKGRVIGEQDLPWIGKALQAAVEMCLPEAHKPRGHWVDKLHELWGETWAPKLSMGQRVKLAEVDRVKLDDGQIALLDMLADNHRLLVSGRAGTGKTLLAIEVLARHCWRSRPPDGWARTASAYCCCASPRRCARGSISRLTTAP